MRRVALTAAEWQRRFPLLQLAALVALFAYGAATIEGFSSASSVRAMLVLAALLGLAAAGQTLFLLIGGLDLSMPGFIVLGAALTGQLCGVDHWPALAAVATIVGLCGCVGGTVGWVCHRYEMVPLIATLAVGTLALGAATVATNGQFSGAAPQAIVNLVAVDATTLGIPVSPVVLIWVVFALIVAIVLHRTVMGRKIFATGANPRAAELALVRTRRIWTGVFATSAIFSGLVGCLLAGFSGASASIGDPYLFDGLTAVIIGGTTFAGTRGDYTHTVVGALILTVLTTVLVGHGFSLADQEIIFGGLILLVVSGYGRERRLRDRI